MITTWSKEQKISNTILLSESKIVAAILNLFGFFCSVCWFMCVVWNNDCHYSEVFK